MVGWRSLAHSLRHGYAAPPPSRREAYRISYFYRSSSLSYKRYLEHKAPSGRELSAKLTEGACGRQCCFAYVISFFCICIRIVIVAFGSAPILDAFRFAIRLRWAAAQTRLRDFIPQTPFFALRGFKPLIFAPLRGALGIYFSLHLATRFRGPSARRKHGFVRVRQSIISAGLRRMRAWAQPT